MRQLGAEVHPGAVISGRYRIDRLLAAGGMGAVFAAEHVELREPVAIKFLLLDAVSALGGDALGRFAREAWAASRIKSEYVVRVSDVGRLASGTPYTVMEYLEGVDLADHLRAHGPLGVDQAVELMLQACEALAEAHALGIYHRDLKPSNLFCVRRSDGLLAIKVLDFGISKVDPAASSFGAAPTTTTARLGTPLYMSPEQMRSSKAAGERSDIWSLGVILYELVTGSVPFTAETLPELAVKVATEQALTLRAAGGKVPAGLERVVARCLEKDSIRRYPDVAALAHALAPFGPVRAVAHAERAQRILQTSRGIEAEGQPATTRRVAAGPASHARLRQLGAGLVDGSRKLPGRLLWILALFAILAGAELASQRVEPGTPIEVGASAATSVSEAAADRSSVLQPAAAEPGPVLEPNVVAPSGALAPPQPVAAAEAHEPARAVDALPLGMMAPARASSERSGGAASAPVASGAAESRTVEAAQASGAAASNERAGLPLGRVGSSRAASKRELAASTGSGVAARPKARLRTAGKPAALESERRAEVQASKAPAGRRAESEASAKDGPSSRDGAAVRAPEPARRLKPGARPPRPAAATPAADAELEALGGRL